MKRSLPVPDEDSYAGSPFVAHPLIRSGHLQTLWSLRGNPPGLTQARLHWVELPEGDRLGMLEDRPQEPVSGNSGTLKNSCVLLIHGICGCSESNYMVRLASRFTALGVRTFRLNLRGCGVGSTASTTITHAGRSDDVLQALAAIARQVPDASLSAIGVSMGGNQLLRAFGTIQQHPCAEVRALESRMYRLAAVSPPIDLRFCSDNLNRWSLRPYGYFFIRQLLSRIPDALVNAPEIAAAKRKIPRTMREFDERVTAPLGGFDDALQYYEWASAKEYVSEIRVPTLVLASDDDPIVPFSSLQSLRALAPNSVRLIGTRGGGHVGFLARGRQRFWMDDMLQRWLGYAAAPAFSQTGTGL